ncbi:MAG: hypothetical protein IT583_02670, partial [Verrucomicrobia bacterium]|nr:hypothetical protein [Verrucomicrobiota bacterium]
MNVFQIVTLIALVGNTSLGIFVLLSNPTRSVNKAFFSLTLFMMLWLGSMFVTAWSWPSPVLLFWVRQTLSFATLIPIGVFILHSTIIEPDIRIRALLFKLKYWLLAAGVVIAVCHSSIFVISATTPTEQKQVPPIEYGWGFFLHTAYFLVVTVFVVVNFWRAAKERTGAQKAEIQFLQMGCVASFILGVVVVTVAELLSNQELSRFVPLSVLVLDGFVTYGIATRRILAVSTVLQRVVSYILMSIYLVCLYVFSVWAIGTA